MHLATSDGENVEPPKDFTECPCGCVWFRLEHPAVTFAPEDGAITGWTGVPVCTHCGTILTNDVAPWMHDDPAALGYIGDTTLKTVE